MEKGISYIATRVRKKPLPSLVGYLVQKWYSHHGVTDSRGTGWAKGQETQIRSS